SPTWVSLLMDVPFRLDPCWWRTTLQGRPMAHSARRAVRASCSAWREGGASAPDLHVRRNRAVTGIGEPETVEYRRQLGQLDLEIRVAGALPVRHRSTTVQQGEAVQPARDEGAPADRGVVH